MARWSGVITVSVGILPLAQMESRWLAVLEPSLSFLMVTAISNPRASSKSSTQKDGVALVDENRAMSRWFLINAERREDSGDFSIG